MANVANGKETGPVSKDVVSGGKKLPILTKAADMSGPNLALSNSSEEARRTIMGMRVQSTAYATQNPGSTLSNMQKKSVSGISNKDFPKI